MLTEENIRQFEQEDGARDRAMSDWWVEYARLKKENADAHDAFRKEHGLPLQSVFQSIAEFRWKRDHP